MKNKKVFITVMVCIILVVSIFFIFFRKNTAKNLKIGNNTTSQEIVDYILNISSYETKVEVEIKSNKSENKYILKQIYNGPEDNWQEVIEPSNIAGIKIMKKGKNLTLENSHLNLTSMYENYEYVSDNSLDLSSFIQDYKENKNAKFKEKENEIIMQTSSGEKKKIERSLYISKQTGMPIKMEIQDTNKKIAVYILYKEVIVNS
ncbi:MAG: hypothetical protein HFJ37_02500 [Clostridia bacterium]|nr:hypothetical protein [Clostridia bacterium]